MALTTASKVNFWNALRVERNIRYRDLSELFGGHISSWAKYFSGQQMPTDENIEKLCDLFEVEFGKGKAEFMKANQEWTSDRFGTKRKLITGQNDARLCNVSSGASEVEAMPDGDYTLGDILALVYGKIPYDTFAQFTINVRNNLGDPLSCIYGSVSYEEYKQIEEAIRKFYNAD